jgi:glycosyltransferase involved in cell wall biosynthesis
VGPTDPTARSPICVLLLPAPLERFILRDQAEDLLGARGVIAVDPARLPYGAFGRLPPAIGDGLAARQGRRLLRSLERRVGTPKVVVIFHALQYQLARAVIAAAGEDCELWYWRWDRYERAYDASPKLRERLDVLHRAAAERASLTVAVSDELVRLERAEGRDAELVPLSADAFPAPQGGSVVAVSLGHVGRRTDWALLRAVAEELGDELVLLFVGAVHEDECAGDPDFAACRALPGLVFLGAVDDEAAARLILVADVGIVPFRLEEFNDAALPYRIIKYARVGRRTITPPLAGVSTWADAVTVADDAPAFAAALREQAGARMRPDTALRDWALEQTARRQNAPLWERLRALGIDLTPKPNP